MRRPLSASARRARVDRWVASLTPFYEVIARKSRALKLGTPRIEGGPTFMDIELPGDRFGKQRIRKNAVWWIGGKNVGFHVDFFEHGVHIEAWTGADRHASVWIGGKASEESLNKDLNMVLAAAGLADLSRMEEARARIFPSRNS